MRSGKIREKAVFRVDACPSSADTLFEGYRSRVSGSLLRYEGCRSEKMVEIGTQGSSGSLYCLTTYCQAK